MNQNDELTRELLSIPHDSLLAEAIRAEAATNLDGVVQMIKDQLQDNRALVIDIIGGEGGGDDRSVMRARLIAMKPEVRKVINIYLWQIFEVVDIRVYQHGRKYPSESKQVYCKNGNRTTMFYWYEVELIN